MDGLLRLHFESQTLLADHAVANADVGLDIAGVAGLSKWFKNMVLKFFTHSNSCILAVKLKQYMPVIHLCFIIAEQYLSFFFIILDSITYDIHKDSF